MSLKIDKEKNGKTLIVKLSGELDTFTAKDLEESLENELIDIEDLTFDLKDLIYVSSAGIRTFIKNQKIMQKQGTMKLINVQDTVKDLFTMTGLIKMINIQE
jgi:anti-sigma B factor antagonist